MNGSTPITQLKGVGDKTSKLFQKVGVYTLRDILLYFPTNYIQYPVPCTIDQVTEEGIYSIQGSITHVPVTKTYGSKSITTLNIKGTSVNLRISWFQSPYIRTVFLPGQTFIFYGKLSKRGMEYQMDHPQYFPIEQYQAKRTTLQPVYSLTKGLTSNLIHKFVAMALEYCDDITELLPSWICEKYQFSSFEDDLRQIHFPETIDHFFKARKHLVYEEFFQFMLQVQKSKEFLHLRKNSFQIKPIPDLDSVLDRLSFQLTQNQREVLQTLNHATLSNISMQRLLQGDVGCGKTIVAFLSMLQVNLSGYQTAIMAPTDVLARQHYENFKKLLVTLNCENEIPLVLLTGSLKAKERKEALRQIETEMNCLIVGTHALFQDAVIYKNLGYIVIDEQHRFGVKQREMLCKKNHNPHLMVMSATPIPRTLAMILYGDMDISTIHEMPANRIPIKNCVIKSSKRPTAYQFIEKELKDGHQAYVICHLIEESEDSEYENVISYHKKLCSFFQNQYKIEILHGKMTADQKEAIMSSYGRHEIDILVSTTVIEVGIDVPNATVILIEDAQAFGLSQLHQLRGRVGRSNLQSYCIMIDSSRGNEENQRLQICNHSNDGFEIAEKDLALRGPGDFFGIRQSGEMNFSIGDIYQDASILQDVSEDVPQYLQSPNCNSEIFLNSLFAEQTFIL